MMITGIRQGDILKIEKIKDPVLVVSKDFFNASGEIIGCPVYKDSLKGPLHIYIETENVKGYVQCEKLALLDMRVRGYAKTDSIPIRMVMDITDAVQGIFDYI